MGPTLYHLCLAYVRAKFQKICPKLSGLSVLRGNFMSGWKMIEVNEGMELGTLEDRGIVHGIDTLWAPAVMFVGL